MPCKNLTLNNSFLQVIPEGTAMPPPVRFRNNNSSVDQTQGNRDRNQHLKSHEQRLAQRHTYYPPEDRDNMYEQVIRQVCYPHSLKIIFIIC